MDVRSIDTKELFENLADLVNFELMDNPNEANNPGDPNETDNPGDPNETDNPGDPNETDNPGDPNETSNPGDPNETDNPGDPNETDNPGDPNETDNPGDPNETDNPGDPNETDNPGDPNETDNPGDPNETDNPGDPNETDNPGDPNETDNPGDPNETVNLGSPNKTDKPDSPNKTDYSGDPNKTYNPGNQNKTDNPCDPKENINPANQNPILGFLEKYRFDELSEYDKLFFLETLRQRGKDPVHYLTVFEYILMHDKLEFLIPLLSRTPLFAFCFNIPSHLKRPWIKNPAWMHDMLYKHKARWNPEGCKCSNHDAEDPDEATQLCIMTRLAFAGLVTDLFSFCCPHKEPVNSMKYLLKAAPDFVFMPTYKGADWLSVHEALVHNSPAAEDLLECSAGMDIGGNTLVDIYKEMKGYYDVINNATDILCKQHGEDIKLYRDKDGNSVLHKLFTTGLMINPQQPFSISQAESYLKKLLKIGLDPTEKNHADRTTLDVLIESFECLIDNYMGDKTLRCWLSKGIRQAGESLTACLQIILPFFLHGSKEFHFLPIDKPPKGPVLQLIHTFKVLFDNDLFTSNIDKVFFRFFDGKSLPWKDINMHSGAACDMCIPLVTLFHQYICRGASMNKPVVNEEEPNRYASYVELFVRKLKDCNRDAVYHSMFLSEYQQMSLYIGQT